MIHVLDALRVLLAIKVWPKRRTLESAANWPDGSKSIYYYWRGKHTSVSLEAKFGKRFEKP